MVNKVLFKLPKILEIIFRVWKEAYKSTVMLMMMMMQTISLFRNYNKWSMIKNGRKRKDVKRKKSLYMQNIRLILGGHRVKMRRKFKKISMNFLYKELNFSLRQLSVVHKGLKMDWFSFNKMNKMKIIYKKMINRIIAIFSYTHKTSEKILKKWIIK